MAVKCETISIKRSRILYKIAQDLQDIIWEISAKNCTHKYCLKTVYDYLEKKNLWNKLRKTDVNFVISELKGYKGLCTKTRYEAKDEKTMSFALLFLKLNSVEYGLFQIIFSLPKRRVLVRLLSQIPNSCGVNQTIFTCFRESLVNSQSKLKSYRHCTLMFDEIYVGAFLKYNKAADVIEGFEKQGNGNTNNNFADHVMVFMAHCIEGTWQQPIAYYFTQSRMTPADIAKNIKEIIINLHKAGLHVLATVCNPHENNVAAIEILHNETIGESTRKGIKNNKFGFNMSGKEIIPLFDTPNLLKGIRDDIMKSKVKFTWKSPDQIGDWAYVIKLSQGDHAHNFNKLSVYHVYPDKVKKSIRYASQIFSSNVSGIMNFVIGSGIDSYDLPENAKDTACFLKFMNNLFDSVNGASCELDDNNKLRREVTTKSPHLKFWKTEALPVLRSMQFQQENGLWIATQNVNNWIKTILGYLHLWKNVHKENRYARLLPRYINLDPLEIFFEYIRNLHKNNSYELTCSSFITSYKTLIVNNIKGDCCYNSSDADRELYGTKSLLNNFREFMNEDTNNKYEPYTEHSVRTEVILAANQSNLLNSAKHCELMLSDLNDNRTIQFHISICQFFIKKFLNIVKGCKRCRNDIQEPENNSSTDYFRRKSLVHTNSRFRKLFSICNEIIKDILPKICHECNISSKIYAQITSKIKNTFTCPKHNLYKKFIKKIVCYYILIWVQNVNRILKGFRQKPVNDPIKEKAMMYKYKYESNNQIRKIL